MYCSSWIFSLFATIIPLKEMVRILLNLTKFLDPFHWPPLERSVGIFLLVGPLLPQVFRESYAGHWRHGQNHLDTEKPRILIQKPAREQKVPGELGKTVRGIESDYYRQDLHPTNARLLRSSEINLQNSGSVSMIWLNVKLCLRKI